MKKKTLGLAFIVAFLLSTVAVVHFLRFVEGNPSTRGIAKVPDPLVVEIKSPFNKTYNTNLIQLNITAKIPGPYTCMYKVDNGVFIDVPLTVRNPVFGGAIDTSILLNLSDGSHTIIVKAEYAVACVSFTINTVPPYLSIMKPENVTHNKSDVPLEYMVADYPQVSYSLDGKANVSITGNTTLTGIIDGIHNLILFGTSSEGAVVASGLVFFGIDTGRPEITFLSIKNNTTYYTYDLNLTFHISEPSREIRYYFWGQPATVITGNVTIRNLSTGLYRLILRAADSFTDRNNFKEIFFGIENPFPTSLVIASIIPVAVVLVGLGLLLYRIKRK